MQMTCHKMVINGLIHTSASFIVSDSENGKTGKFNEPAADLSFYNFAKSLAAHVGAFI